VKAAARLGLLAAGALVLTGCYKRRDLSRADWPAIADAGRITVRTLDGRSQAFPEFAFTTDGLVGWSRRWAANAPVSDSVIVPLDSIAVVRAVALDRGRTRALLAAATTFAFVVIAEAQSSERPEAIPRPVVSSPFIYSFDGKDYVFDSETFAGAVARGLERADVDNLDHLRDVGGSYRLRLTNERPETHYTDELALLVADHPAETRAFPDAAGAVQIVGNGVAPVAISEYGGDTIPSRAGWELTFLRPAGDNLALILKTRNTTLAPFILTRVLSLLGTDVYSWYGLLGSNYMARSVVRGWIESEGYLEIQAQSAAGEAWWSVGKLPDVGPEITKANVVVLNLAGAVGDIVRLRVESSPGLWLLQSAELAAHRGKTDVRALRPSRAEDEHGTDVTALLGARDSTYLVTLPGSAVRLRFDAPSPVPGMERTVFARTTGHYYVHGDDTRPPQRDVVMRIMRDRAFAQRYLESEWRKSGGAMLFRRR
jgi:hypothetical protein